jgi:DNA-binding sugar fermentation-stimulating protein
LIIGLWNSSNTIDGKLDPAGIAFDSSSTLASTSSIVSLAATRLYGLLMPDADVLIREDHIINGYSSLKTKHTLFAVKCKGILVGIDSRMPNYILESSLRAKEFSGWTIIRNEVSYNDSRI